jgi:hypothetical protein
VHMVHELFSAVDVADIAMKGNIFPSSQESSRYPA